MQEPGNTSKPANKIVALLEESYKIELSRDLEMNFEDNSIPSDCSENPDMVKELYKKTPLKKRPIQPSFLSDEKEEPPKPMNNTVIVQRVSKRKMYKPVKKHIEPRVASTSFLESVPTTMINAPTEAKASTSVEEDKVAVANSEFKKPACDSVDTDVPSKSSTAPKSLSAKDSPCVNLTKQVHISAGTSVDKDMGKDVPSKSSRITRSSKSTKSAFQANLTKQEMEDYQVARKVQCTENGLRSRGKDTSDTKVNLGESSSANTENNSGSPVEAPKAVAKVQKKQKVKAIPKQASKVTETEQDVPAGNDSQNMYVLSPELASIVGKKKMKLNEVIEAIVSVFKKRNLVEPNGIFANCDDELSEKLFSGQRRIQLADLEDHLKKHLNHEG